jgi:hypothetical protein
MGIEIQMDGKRSHARAPREFKVKGKSVGIGLLFS